MMIQSIQKGGSTTTVNVHRIADDRPVTDDLLAGFAMAKAGEDPSSLFGWTVRRYPDERAAVVSLHTD